MDASHIDSGGAPAPGPSEEAPAAPWLGRAVAHRLTWHARLASRRRGQAVGSVARRGRRFSSVVGRSLAARSALGVRAAIAGRASASPLPGSAMGTVVPPSRAHFSAARVAAHFGVTPKTVYRWMESGRIRFERRPGGSYRIPAAQFHASDGIQQGAPGSDD